MGGHVATDHWRIDMQESKTTAFLEEFVLSYDNAIRIMGKVGMKWLENFETQNASSDELATMCCEIATHGVPESKTIQEFVDNLKQWFSRKTPAAESLENVDDTEGMQKLTMQMSKLNQLNRQVIAFKQSAEGDLDTCSKCLLLLRDVEYVDKKLLFLHSQEQQEECSAKVNELAATVDNITAFKGNWNTFNTCVTDMRKLFFESKLKDEILKLTNTRFSEVVNQELNYVLQDNGDRLKEMATNEVDLITKIKTYIRLIAPLTNVISASRGMNHRGSPVYRA